MKLRIFINIHYLEVVGDETSLIFLLIAMDPARADVDLFLNDHRGEMMRFIPEWVNVLPECKPYTMIERPIKNVLKAGFWRIAAARMRAKIRFRFYSCRKKPVDGSAIFSYVGHCVTPLLPSLHSLGEYDLAISYVAPHHIVLDKVLAKRKICWIHTDYTCIDVNPVLEAPVWSGYDHIVSISEAVTRNFCAVFPLLKDKVTEVENILPADFIRGRAREQIRPTDMPEIKGISSLLTIGRYAFAKRLEEIPSICRRLIEKGMDVRWYIIGYGGSDEYIRKAIADEGMGERVFLLGKRENPYPYIAACDWYVQPSRYEGKSVTVREAQLLGKPVIVTDYPTASSQIRDRVDGVIVPMPWSDCADAMADVLKNASLKNRIAEYLATHDWDNRKEVEKIFAFAR